MSNKLYGLLTILALVKPAFCEKVPFTGAYAGLKLGASLLEGDHEYKNATDGGKFSLRGFGASLGCLAGYMKMADNKTWFGGEISYEKKTNKTSNQMNGALGNMGKSSISLDDTLSIAGMIGAAYNPRVVVYAKTAIESTRYSFKYDNLQNPPTSFKATKRVNNFVPCAGGFYKVSDSLLIGAEYGYVIALKKISLTVNDISVTYKPAEHRLTLTARYLF